MVSRTELSAPIGEGSIDNRTAHLTHQSQVKVNIVVRRQPQPEYLIGLKQMTQIGAMIHLARGAAATFIDRSIVICVGGVAHANTARGGEQRAVAGVAGGNDTIEHVHPAFDAID
jgi:hypothetical protein